MRIPSIGKYSPTPGSTLTIHFEDSHASGSAGCNSYGGGYQVNGNQIKFEQIESTVMACADPSLMEQETIFMQSLGEAQSFEIVEGQLQIYRSDGEALTFVPAQ